MKGKSHNDYPLMDGEELVIKELCKLPNTWSAQMGELFTLNQADSKYTFRVAQMFGKIWAG